MLKAYHFTTIVCVVKLSLRINNFDASWFSHRSWLRNRKGNDIERTIIHVIGISNFNSCHNSYSVDNENYTQLPCSHAKLMLNTRISQEMLITF